jgi:hypothetical protein
MGWKTTRHLPVLVAQILQEIFDQNVHGARMQESR